MNRDELIQNIELGKIDLTKFDPAAIQAISDNSKPVIDLSAFEPRPGMKRYSVEQLREGAKFYARKSISNWQEQLQAEWREPENRVFKRADIERAIRNPPPEDIPHSEAGSSRRGYNGASHMDSGYFFAPHVPMTSTPVVLDQNNFQRERIVRNELREPGFIGILPSYKPPPPPEKVNWIKEGF